MLTRTTLAAAALAVAAAATPSTAAATTTIDLSKQLNADCTAKANMTVEANCMGERLTGFVQESMPTSKTLTVKGVTFAWPDQSAGNDVVAAAGQTLPVTKGAGFANVALLVSGHRGNRTGDVQVSYADGTRTYTSVKAPDWFKPNGRSSVPGLKVQQYAQVLRPATGFDDGGIYLVTVPLAKGKVVKSIGLPSSASEVMVYAVSLTTVTPTTGPVFN